MIRLPFRSIPRSRRSTPTSQLAGPLIIAGVFSAIVSGVGVGAGAGHALAQEPASEAGLERIARAAAALELRAIGPAVMGGRISDIKVHPERPNTWYVAVGSGGVWKTTNAGTTWTPIFDDERSYSIGTVALDPTHPEVVWVGTGENVSGRHVAWGDGVYRSRNGGQSWTRVGLERSEHIGRILVDPRDGDRVLVAAEGPLWAPGGERGVYRTTDGGETWTAVLEIDEDTGVTDLEFHPSDPDIVYAAAYQRRRHVWSFLAGGPNSGIYKSTDGGDTWRRIESGLPSGDMGKIGLAVTPADPRRVYATIEAAQGQQGFYRSLDEGESWERRNGYTSGGTGPHYYQEIEASPTDPDLVYQADVFVQVTRDAGASFDVLGTGREKHSDDHAIWIDPDDGQHMLVGSDAGLYETFDEGLTWRHFSNMPIAQFYRVALSENEPFYEVLGGAQDLGTLHGPARTTNIEGVRNQDWYVPLGADGYHVAIDPRDANTLYLMTQNGNLVRTDRRSEEGIGIRPQPAPGDPPERWNWDSPLLISPHDPDRLYFGSQRLWRSDDQGDAWQAVSDDLTQNLNRYELEMMGRVWSVDALYHQGAMSRYSTLTAISESAVAEGVLYTGSDDGLVHVSEDGGDTWRRAADLPGVPARTFINDVEASQHDAASVFAVADNHKMGDFSAYVFESTDHGRSWRSIAGDLPEGTTVWAIQQDHVEPDLLFLGTEFGLYFSPDRGGHWIELSGGVPTISFRDLKLQRRDDDLVGATFGRGFYVLDDYSPLRAMAAGALADDADGDATLFPVRDTWWYVPSTPGQAPGLPTWGSTYWRAPNPPHGATFTYHLTDVPPTQRAARREGERELRRRGEDVPFPGLDRLRAEALESEPMVLLGVRDTEGRPVRWVEGPARTGLHRVTWDMRGPPPDPVDLSSGGFRPPWASDPRGPLVPPGRYEVELLLVSAEGVTPLAGPEPFELRPVPTTPAGTDLVAATAFQREASDLMRRIAGASDELGRAAERLRYMRAALVETPRAAPTLFQAIDSLEARVADLRMRLNGDPARQRLNEFSAPGIRGRVGSVVSGHGDTRQEPTATQRRDLEIGTDAFGPWLADLRRLVDDEIPRLEAELEAAGAPWTPGRRLPGG